MTPSEKKARADIVSEIIQESNRYEDGVISSDQFLGFLNEALDAAERRGFERARNLAINWFAKNGYEALKREFENLKYKEA